MKSLPSLLIAAVFALLTFAVWAYLNRPAQEPPWPKVIKGFAFSPFRINEDPTHNILPTVEEIDADLKLVQGKAASVRTYSVQGTLAQIPELAEARNMNVAIGAWIDDHREKNEQQLQTAIRLADSHVNVVRVFIGNEVLLRGDLPIEELEKLLDRARDAIEQPVGTAETWHTWLTHPTLAQHVDFIGVHLLPYWEGVPVDQAVDYSLAQFKRLQKAFPHKPIVIAEIGWPSRGRTHESAVASDANEALFLRRFLARAQKEQLTYYVMEAFDQPWKAYMEGAVGSYWGVWDVNRHPKFEFSAPIVRVPEWHVLAAISVAVSLLLLGVLYLNSDALRNRGRSFLALVVYAAGTLAVWVIYDFTQQYMTVPGVISGVLLLLGMLGVMLVLLAEAHEWAEAHWVRIPPPPRRAALQPERRAPAGLDPRAGLQRAARHADRDARCARAPRLPGLRSAGDRQQHARTRRYGARWRRTAPGSGRASASSTSRRWRASRPARSTSRCATPILRRRSSPSSTATTWSSRTGCATSRRPSTTSASPSCRRRRTIATPARAPSRPCATRSTAASSTSA